MSRNTSDADKAKELLSRLLRRALGSQDYAPHRDYTLHVSGAALRDGLKFLEEYEAKGRKGRTDG